VFDISKMTEVATKAILDFSEKHENEVFYAFAIDANLLCLNSVDSFRETLNSFQLRWPDEFDSPEQIEKLRFDTGDWKYQGFYDLKSEDGFDEEMYEDHYYIAMDSPTFHAPHTDYAIAMNRLLARLQHQDSFSSLKRTLNFTTRWVEHSY